MKKVYLFAIAAAALVGCSSNDLVDGPGANGPGTGNGGQTPIEFNVQKQNITRAANLEDIKHYNFGVWAWKVEGKNSLPDAEVMNHYLVGYSNSSDKGYYYDASKTTTYATTPGTVNDHKSPWFYEGLGTSEYTYNTAGSLYYVNDLASNSPMAWVDYKSVNDHQYLRYWDLAYNKTNFYCYAPYNKNVKFEHTGEYSTMTFDGTVIRDGYDEPLNSDYKAYSRTLGEFMYAGVQTQNANLADVTVPFKHMGAQLFIRFYEDVPGYRVEIIDLCADNGNNSLTNEDMKKGIQATPAVVSGSVSKYTKEEAIEKNATLTGALNSTEALTAEQATAYNKAITGGNKTEGETLSADEAAAYNATLPGAVWEGYIKGNATYAAGTYFTTQGATVTFAESNAAATYEPSWSGSTTKSKETPLMFKIPQTETYSTSDVAPHNLDTWTAPTTNKTHKTIPAAVADGAQKYSYSPTIYYPVAQPKKSNNELWKNTGFTFHVSYRIISETNGEVITVHNATVHVPVVGAIKKDGSTNPATPSTDIDDHKDGENYYITAWQPNVKYTYTFKIKRGSTGTTNPDTNIDPTNPEVNPHTALYPIVFDFATIDDYTTNFSEYTVSEENSTGY